MKREPAALVAEFGERLADLGWITALHVGGSLATGDYRPSVSDLDLVAVTAGLLTDEMRASLVSIHEVVPRAAKLGCSYVPTQLIAVPAEEHTTWTHGQLIQRRLSGLSRAELVRHGYTVLGPEPSELWPAMSSRDLRRAVLDELTGYWTWAVHRPWLWHSTSHVDLSVTTMLRARHTLSTGELLTKSAALAGDGATHLPASLVQGVRARRDGADTRPHARLPLDALDAWRLTRRTIAQSRPEPGVTSRG